MTTSKHLLATAVATCALGAALVCGTSVANAAPATPTDPAASTTSAPAAAAQDPGAGGIAVSRNADGTEDVRPMTDEERSEMDGKWSPVDR
ncbi:MULTISPECIES: hypothetical protein [unclassified Curtobacterium]|jgi:hypothetical protein|uniref:hypothetical protein n=1 Tax=unclassified Curtobacterium TaxID=257496 RepID=UPI001AE25F3F|nr:MULTISPECIES: hypothetical protein [unclassified Curtobacterium]MBP1302524.1 hypothetical protein [Curtobacterium sp. 1310]MDT0211733.1 hypothetical protein [Curtobacterium sp. BRD11]